MVGVSETEWKSLSLAAMKSFGTGTMKVVFRDVGTAAWASDRLKISTRAAVNCPAHVQGLADLGALIPLIMAVSRLSLSKWA